MTLAKCPPEIAVVGVGCRFPGGVHDLESLWHILSEGRNVWSDVPADRFNWQSFHHTSQESNTAHSHRGGHFLDQDIAAFDAEFFGITNAEAEAMDPQQRIELEIAYEALENAGIPLDTVKGSKASVYVATFTHDYENMMYKDMASLPKYGMTGVGQAIVSNRISYAFDLRGPSLTLDTGCSGSLVALHLACQSLRLGESDMGLVGGTSLMLSPDTMIPMDKIHLLNKDGKCYSFDNRGSGYGRGEGAAMIILKRLDDALYEELPIRGVIRSTAIGQDGKTSGITLPNAIAQQDLIRSAYEHAHLDPDEVAYVEAHGTGTTAGDVTEVEAIADVFCPKRSPNKPLFVGSIKGNIGHLESTSGIAGLIKVLLVLEKGMIPPTPNFIEPKEKLNLELRNIHIPRVLREWPIGEARRASVNSFGYGGANAHAILENKPADRISQAMNDPGLLGTADDVSVSVVSTSGNRKANRRLYVIPVTAYSEKSLSMAIANLHKWLAVRKGYESYIDDLVHTLTLRRTVMRWRYTFVTSTREDAMASLRSGSLNVTRAAKNHRMVFVFTGQGAQWAGMARELLEIPAFERSISQCTELLRNLGAPWSLTEELKKDSTMSRVHDSYIGQPATTAIQMGLVDLLCSLRIQPQFVLGHSSGEIAAAYAAGSLTKESAILISYHRSFLSKRCKDLGFVGGMLAVGLGEAETNSYISRITCGRAMVACCNSPLSTTVSGDEKAILELKRLLECSAVSVRRLRVDTAYHSHHMSAVSEGYSHALSDLVPESAEGSVRFFSSVSTTEKTTEFGPQYWIANLVSKVRFYEALQNICSELRSDTQASSTSYCHIFMEIGPHSTLVAPIKQTLTQLKLDSFRANCLSALTRGRDSRLSFLQALGNLFDHGMPVNLASPDLTNNSNRKRSVLTNLSPYPWDHSRTYWHEPRISKDHRLRLHPYHDLLGLRCPGDSLLEPVWGHLLGDGSLPWLRDHVVDGRMVFPASGYIAMAIEAKRQISNDRYPLDAISRYVLEDVRFVKVLEIPATAPVEVHLSLYSPIGTKRTFNDWEHFRISSFSADGSTTENCYGRIRVEKNLDESELGSQPLEGQSGATALRIRLDNFKRTPLSDFDTKRIYGRLRSKGHYWGPNFALIREFNATALEATGKITIQDVSQCMPGSLMQPHVIHPTTLDALIHSSLFMFAQTCDRGLMFPVAIGGLSISSDLMNSPGGGLEFATTLDPQNSSSARTQVSAFKEGSSSGSQPSLEIWDGDIQGAPGQMPSSIMPSTSRDLSYQIDWDVDFDLCNPRDTPKDFLYAKDDGEEPGQSSKELNDAVLYFIGLCIRQTDRTDVQNQHLEYYEWISRHHKSGQIQEDSSISFYPDEHGSLERIKSLGPEGEALYRIGSNLSSILTGRSNPLSLLLEDNLLSRVYAENHGSLRCFAHMIDYAKGLTFKNPQIAMLEVGAGTAGATLPLLEALSCDSFLPLKSYDFTDISAGFFDDARQKLSKWDEYIRYKTLDIGKDPGRQGFSEASYDLVIAYNALHTAANVDDAITNTRRLLKPGGKLLLIENTKSELFIDTIFGALPGWYMGMPKAPALLIKTQSKTNLSVGRIDGREVSPILSVGQWNKRLLNGSFNGVEFATQDVQGPTGAVTMMISRAVDIERNPGLLEGCHVLIHPRTSAGCRALSLALMDRPEVIYSQASLEDFSSQDLAADDVFVILDEGDDPLIANSNFKVSGGIKSLLTCTKRILWIMLTKTSRISSSHSFDIRSQLAGQVSEKHLELVTLDVQQEYLMESSDIVDKIIRILHQSFSIPITQRERETDYVYKDGLVMIPRLKPSHAFNVKMREANHKRTEARLFNQSGPSIRLNLKPSPKPDSLHFVYDEHPEPSIGSLEIEIQCEAFGVNSGDALIALGQSQSSTPTMGEYAGFITSVGCHLKNSYAIGDRVICLGRIAYANRIFVDVHLVQNLPQEWTFALGASIPVAFTTALYALTKLTNLSQGQFILIHAAAESLGQAAIQIAQHIGATVLATVYRDSERDLLVKRLKLPDDHVFLSKTQTVLRETSRVTKGCGVNVILGAVVRETPKDCLACLAHFGKFVGFGCLDVHAFPMDETKHLHKNIAVQFFDLVAAAKHQPQEVGQTLAQIMKMFEEGKLHPIFPLEIMDLTDAESAFKLAASEERSGKVVLETKPHTMVHCAPTSVPVLSLCSEGAYVITGDLGIIWLDICRYMISRNVKHVVIITWEAERSKQHKVVEDTFRDFGICVYQIKSNVSCASSCDDLVSRLLHHNPPVKGIIRINFDEESALSRTSAQHNDIISRALEKISPDFSLILSSSGDVLEGRKSFSYTSRKSLTLTLCVSGMIDNGLAAQDYQSEQLLIDKGLVPMTENELEALLDCAIFHGGLAKSSSYVVSGFDRRSAAKSDQFGMLDRPLFRHLPQPTNDDLGKGSDLAPGLVEETLADAKSRDGAHQIIFSALRNKMSTLVAMEPEMLDQRTPIEDYGLDSLILWGVRNWIFGNFRVDLEPSEISDAPSIDSLASKILDRTKFGESEDQNSQKETHSKIVGKEPTTLSEIPRQPLPRLEDTLQNYMETVRPFCSDGELQRTKTAVTLFQKAGGLGGKLQSRLEERDADPRLDNWLADLYMRRRYLRLRSPLVACQSYFGTHPNGRIPHDQAERAAVITVAAMQFKHDLEAKKLPAQYNPQSGEAVDTESYQRLFNTCREPHLREDQIRKYPHSDHIVVMRYGRAFRVENRASSAGNSFIAMKAAFEQILKSTTKGMLWVSGLTADDRDAWAKAREDLLKVSDQNSTSIRSIESAAFLVCLDDAQPESPAERCYQFLYGDGSNRWYDKTLQLIICKNGVSASLCEHSALDGSSVEPLHEYINRSIRTHDPQRSLEQKTQESHAVFEMELLPLSTTEDIELQITHLRQSLKSTTSAYTFGSLKTTKLGRDFLRVKKCPIQSGIQLAIQLACRRFFGYNPPALETVSMAHFRQGRVDVHHINRPAVLEFLAAIDEGATASSDKLRSLFYEAARAHAKSLSRVAKGRGFSRHMLALEWMLEEGEETPALFQDPSNAKMKPGKVMTSNFTTGWLEGGFAYPVPESILVYFEIEDESVSFSIFGNGVDAERFSTLLASATYQCHTLLDEGM